VGLLALGLAAERVPPPARLLADAFFLDPPEPEPAERLTAERLPSSLPARVEVDDRRVVFRFEPPEPALLGLVAERLASVFPARLAVIRLGALDFFALGRFGADFLVEDFFFAGICPPSDGDRYSPVASARSCYPTVFLRVIASASAKDKH
jgi:hypothetical protein